MKQPQTSTLAVQQHSEINRVAWLLILAGCVAVFFGNLRFGSQVLAVGFEDDFFYYLQAARNFAAHGVSTFDGIHSTNGYHPLWFLLLAFVEKIAGSKGIFALHFPTSLALALEFLQTFVVCFSAFFVSKICSLWLRPKTSACIQLLFACWDIVLVRTGMEAGLVIAAILVLLWFRLRPAFQWSASTAFVYGLLASVMVLSRLDAILLLGLLILVDFLPVHLPSKTKVFLAFITGLFPIAAYVAINVIFFGVATPISGAAKQLRHHHLPSLFALHSFATYFFSKTSPLLLPAVLITAFALLWVFAHKRFGTDGDRIRLAVLIFPFVQLLLVVSLSDWALWQWYLYPWLIGATVAVTCLPWKPNTLLINGSTIACGIFFVTYLGLVALRSNPANNLTWQAGLQIQAFRADHPGLYAMGDRSGAVGYLLDGSVIQTEGLMMDKDFLQNIRQSKNLIDVLKDYHVRYYISTRAVRDEQGCYSVKEPWQAGSDSPSMHGVLCAYPVATFIHGPFVNDIFDLNHLSDR